MYVYEIGEYSTFGRRPQPNYDFTVEAKHPNCKYGFFILYYFRELKNKWNVFVDSKCSDCGKKEPEADPKFVEMCSNVYSLAGFIGLKNFLKEFEGKNYAAVS